MKINGRSFSDYEPGKTFALDLPAHSLSSPGLSPSLDFTEVQHRLISTSDVCDPVSEATQTNRQHRFPHRGGQNTSYNHSNFNDSVKSVGSGYLNESSDES